MPAESEQQKKNEIANLRAIVKNDMATNPDPGTDTLPPSHDLPQMNTYTAPALSDVDWQRWVSGTYGIYYVIYAVVSNGSDRKISDELCGVKVIYSQPWSCP